VKLTLTNLNIFVKGNKMILRSNLKRLLTAPAIITVIFLLIPLTAMQFDNGVDWSSADFIIAGFLIFSTASAYKLLTYKYKAYHYRAAIGLSLLSGLMLVWVNLAVGILGSENNPVNLLYGIVLLAGLLGAIASGLKPAGLMYTMFTMAVLQISVPLAGIMIEKPAGMHVGEFLYKWHQQGFAGVAGVTIFFTALFAGAGLLFRNAAKLNQTGG